MKSVVVLMCILGVSLCLPVQERWHGEGGTSSSEVEQKLNREARSSSREKYRRPMNYPYYPPAVPPGVPNMIPPVFPPVVPPGVLPSAPVSPNLSLLERLALLLQ
ncbi:YLP motif-containing protein 1-like [Erpetoichthys calabaricus]|uniref:YLP motif-containing protein 1-like n=1 Tax=Erpetoichthys calabaricus TaxID=27687 RepID=UPI002234E4F7|nr:YLP motif-containing protein 1-like [Erpetoichthys calabaricus]